ncbi:MAG TPA: hypothetical protein PLA74_02500 [Syntrophales bacterium]|nr:hypothetical protein [Syntrophales bacterium]
MATSVSSILLPLPRFCLCLYDHAVFDGGDTGADVGYAVDIHDAVGAPPDGAEDTPRFLISPGETKIPLSRGDQCRGDDFALIGFDLRAVDNDADSFFAFFLSPG